jgi:outer membrane immunogenic protein
MKKILLAGIALAALVGQGVAADLPPRPAPVPYKAPPPVVVAYSWTGCYFGGAVGGSWRRTDWDDFFPGFAGPGLNDYPASHSNSSWAGGAQVGCNYQINNFVIGIEGNWIATGNKGVTTQVNDAGILRDSTSSSKSIWDVAGRLGWAVNNWLIYGKGGWAGTSVDFQVTRDTDQALMALASGVRANGFVVGAGVEYGVTQNFVLGLEYDYYGFKIGDQNNVQQGAFIAQNLINIKHQVQTLTLRASFLFGPGPVVARY